jgi:hypothetical protein
VGLFSDGDKHVVALFCPTRCSFMDILWSVVENPKLILLHQMIEDSVLKTETSGKAWSVVMPLSGGPVGMRTSFLVSVMQSL